MFNIFSAIVIPFRIGLYGLYSGGWKWNTILISYFLDPSGAVHPEITNRNGNPSYKYFYSNADHGETLVFLMLLTSVTGVFLLFFKFRFPSACDSCCRYEGSPGEADGRRLQADPRRGRTLRSTRWGRRRQGLHFHRPEPNTALGIHLPTH